MPEKKELWITSAEAAEILTQRSAHHVSDAYVRRLAINGKLSSKMIGKKTRLFNRAEVEAYTVKKREKKGQGAEKPAA
ncbi:MAG: helix-turn-helix domain-containing protein [Ktedonobacteraceae bacterium]